LEQVEPFLGFLQGWVVTRWDPPQHDVRLFHSVRPFGEARVLPGELEAGNVHLAS
jgi:hypothetical protein